MSAIKRREERVLGSVRVAPGAVARRRQDRDVQRPPADPGCRPARSAPPRQRSPRPPPRTERGQAGRGWQPRRWAMRDMTCAPRTGFLALLGGWVPAPARRNPSQTLLMTSAGAALHHAGAARQGVRRSWAAEARAASSTLLVVDRLVRQAGGRVADHARSRALPRPRWRAAIVSMRGGHADEVGAGGAQHPDLGGRLEVRAGKPAYTPSASAGSSSRARSRSRSSTPR